MKVSELARQAGVTAEARVLTGDSRVALGLVAVLERGSVHSLATALRIHAGHQGAVPLEIRDFDSVTGAMPGCWRRRGWT